MVILYSKATDFSEFLYMLGGLREAAGISGRGGALCVCVSETVTWGEGGEDWLSISLVCAMRYWEALRMRCAETWEEWARSG
jgi:hypothetical protein